MLAVVAPVFHFTVPEHPLAVKVAVSLLHKLVLSALITGAAGLLPVVMVITLDVSLTPQMFSQTALYVPDTLTVMLLAVEPVFHLTVPPFVQPVAVKVALSFAQIVVLSVLIVGLPDFVPVRMMMLFDELLSPQLLLHVAVYVPDVLT